MVSLTTVYARDILPCLLIPLLKVQTSSTRQGPGLNLKEAVKSLTFSDMSSGTGGYKRRRACNRCAMARTRVREIHQVTDAHL